MTIRELYEWAKANGCADYDIVVECYDGYADELDADVDESILKKYKYGYKHDVVINCRS